MVNRKHIHIHIYSNAICIGDVFVPLHPAQNANCPSVYMHIKVTTRCRLPTYHRIYRYRRMFTKASTRCRCTLAMVTAMPSQPLYGMTSSSNSSSLQISMRSRHNRQWMLVVTCTCLTAGCIQPRSARVHLCCLQKDLKGGKSTREIEAELTKPLGAR